MTTSKHEGLVERLEATFLNGGDGEYADLEYLNPDGPEAAAVIRSLEAQAEAFCLLIDRLETWPISYATGCCMCGSPMEGHPVYDNHAPTDEGEYKIGEALRAARAALSPAGDL